LSQVVWEENDYTRRIVASHNKKTHPSSLALAL
jgi:hypothetical protein